MAEPASVEAYALEPGATEPSEIDAQFAAADEIAVDRGLTETGLVDAGAPDETPPTPAHARLGSEGVLRLRARHAEVRARISERIQDPARQDELKTQAERLNPDTWVTAAEVSTGLEEYETVFEALRTAVGGQRRGRRHKRRRTSGQPEAAGRPEDPENEDS